MNRKHKVFLVLLAACIVSVGFRMLQPKDQIQEMQAPTQEEIRAMEKRMTEAGMALAGTEMQEQAETQGYKYNQDMGRKMDVDTSYLSNFLGEGKQFILKKQIQQLAGERAESAYCLAYTRSDPDNMRLEFYILLDTGDILQGFYDFQNGKTAVQGSELTEEDVWALQEEEEERMKQEEQKAEEKEKKRAAREAAGEQKEAGKGGITETGQPVEIELEEDE